MFGRKFGWVVPALGILLATSRGRAAVLDGNFEESNYVFAAAEITSMAWAPDASQRLFLTRKSGQVLIVKNGALLATAFATLTPVYTASECGLLGVAFDPDFSRNGYVYFFVTISASTQQIVRYTANGDVGTDRTVIVSDLPTAGQNHDGGALGFGPDGKLYWGIGDLGNGTGVDADLTSLAAKIGRVNRDGSLPTDNPFSDGAGSNDDRIWARGFRNPYTLSFQPSTGQLWINTVGTSYEQVFRPSAGEHAGYNDYENNQPTGYLSPAIAYRTNGTNTFNISSALRSGGTATFSTTTNPRLRSGARITVAGVADTSFNGVGFVTSASSTGFSFAQAGSDATSSGGTATTENIGGCITGGTFWDSSAPAPAYRGNFFFGDFNSGFVQRVRLATNNDITAVEPFATGAGSIVDTDIGPDGNLYYAQYNGNLKRTRFLATAQALVVSRLHRQGWEGGSVFFHVRLAQAPAADVPVTVERASGDADVTVVSGAALTFTSANWSSPQPVEIELAQDSDTVGDTATIRVASSGLTSEDVLVRVTDDDALGIVLSTTALALDEGGSETFEVALNGPPGEDVTVTAARESGDSTVTVTAGSELVFSDADWSTPRVVTVAAAQDADVENESATLVISADGLTARHVAVSVVDDEPSAPVITTSADTSAVQGARYVYDVDASGLPEPSFSLETAPDGMSIDTDSGLVAWTPPTLGEFAVSVRASNGVAPDAIQSFTLEVVADAAPNCTLTAPGPGAVVSGTASEFFGDVSDDVGTTHAEFSFDGIPAYDDVNDSGHYHFGGAHLLFDTTALADGVHVLRMTGYDTSGQACYAEVSVTVDNEPDAGSGGTAGQGSVGGTAGSPASGGNGSGPGGAAGNNAGGDSAGGDSAAGDNAGGDNAGGDSAGGDNAGGADGLGGTLGEAGGSGAPSGASGSDTGGEGGTAGAALAGTGGMPASGGGAPVATGGSAEAEASGCSCRTAPTRSNAALPFLIAALALASARRRTRILATWAVSKRRVSVALPAELRRH